MAISITFMSVSFRVNYIFTYIYFILCILDHFINILQMNYVLLGIMHVIFSHNVNNLSNLFDD